MPATEPVDFKVFLGVTPLLILMLFGIVSCGGATTTAGDPVEGADNANLLGINIAAPLDYEIDRLYADAIMSSRTFVDGINENSTTPAALDSDGWPTADFSFYVWGSGAKKDGTYALSFTGSASVSRNPGGSILTTYNSATNTSTGTFQITSADASSTLALRFASTKRNAASATGTGVTSIKLMRPLTPGSAQTYPMSALFTDQIKALIGKFSAIRFMDFLATNSNVQQNWSERPLPSWPSFNRYANTGGYGWQGIGGPWEHVILLANETQKDAWINIPVDATDAYITNVANLFRYGSDGINPYTSPQANPVYPPLDANLNVYVEYSNELWNSAGAFRQFHSNCLAASNELVGASGVSPLNWDSTWNGVAYNQATAQADGWDWNMCWRNIAKRGAEISNNFRTVFGDAAMGVRIRPVLMTQLGATNRVLGPAMKMMTNYYAGMGSGGLASPHPPKYYFYGAGGSAYYNPASTVSSLDAFFADPGFNPSGVEPAFQADMHMAAAMGLKRIAYEGGPSLDTLGGARDAVSPQAINDPRMTTAIVNLHNAWSSNGGDLLVYYRATGDYQWGFTPDIYDFATRKLYAIDALNVAAQAPPTLGTLVPGSLAGTAANACARGWGCNANSFSATGTSPLNWASYTFRSSEASSWTVNLSVTGSATVAVYVDGTQAGAQQATTGGALSFDAGTISAGIHGVIVRAVSGTFSIGSVAVE
ncbi:MAG: hypothetical protein KJ795_02335 [Gammaproteobacteria bacterium]|nr:hypothetical protein [Gammaproteobacteria bacterium]MBU1775555.1 hypothetical protein [Gammaproteobacteria bacterium]MBU1967605.1 hypothetical protein [Gammaproteobacteria bacterium]